jgi:ribosomal protein S18 acetylase RimI-like enzyme
MQCSCADNWSTTRIAAEKGLVWKTASYSDSKLIEIFLREGGTGNRSIDKFAREGLLTYADARYANTFLLISAEGRMIGFVTNAMGSVKITDSDLMGMNMLPAGVSEIPVLFLHRIGVSIRDQRKGAAKLMVWRIFEVLSHSCINSAAAAVALLVEPDNEPAKSLYASLLFEKVNSHHPDHELHILPYEAALRQIPK